MTNKALRAGGLNTADLAEQKYRTYCEILPEDVAYADVFHPAFWRHHKKLKPNDVVRLIQAKGDFDIFVTVRHVVAGGVVVDFLYGRTPAGIDVEKIAEETEAALKAIEVVPVAQDGKPVVRIEYLPKTKWRLLGLGSEEVERDLSSKDQAETRMAIYLHQIRMRLPTDAEILSEVKLRESEAKKKVDA